MTDRSLSTTMKADVHAQVVAYYFKEWHGFHMPFHAHDAIEIMYVISGECSVEVEDHTLSMRKGQYVFIDSEIPHRLVVEQSNACRMLNLEFVLKQASRSFPSMKQLAMESKDFLTFVQQEQSYVFLKDINGVYQTLKNLVMELDNTMSDNYLMIHILLTRLLLLISRSDRDAKEGMNEQSDLYVKKTVDYLHQNYDYDLKMKDLAAWAHLHPSYLHRIFKRTIGCSVMEYLTQIRIDKAKMLLSHTDISVTDVSNYVGMNSSQYFSKVFKKNTGVSPLEYRTKTIDHIRS